MAGHSPAVDAPEHSPAVDAPTTASYNPWGAALPESVQFIVFDFVVPGRRTYDGRGRRVLRDTMNDTSETLCDDRVESSPLWDLKLQPASRAWRAARDGQGLLRGFCFCCGHARCGEFTDGRLRRGD